MKTKAVIVQNNVGFSCNFTTGTRANRFSEKELKSLNLAKGLVDDAPWKTTQETKATQEEYYELLKQYNKLTIELVKQVKKDLEEIKKGKVKKMLLRFEIMEDFFQEEDRIQRTCSLSQRKRHW